MKQSIRLSALACAVVLACGIAQAADFPTTPPAPGPAPKLRIPTPVRQVLANGMEVVTVARPGLPLVTAQLLLRSGGEMDPADKAGLADLTATLMTKGAAGRSASELAEAADALGGSLGSSAGWDMSGVGMTVMKSGNVVVVPIRSGIGLRAGVNVGYLKFTQQPTWNPF